MWDWAVWGALVVAICSGVTAMVLVLRRTRDAVRSVKSVQSRAVASLRALETKAELAAAKAERAGDTRELEESVARLRGSIAQLAILRAALADVGEKFAWIRPLL